MYYERIRLITRRDKVKSNVVVDGGVGDGWSNSTVVVSERQGVGLTQVDEDLQASITGQSDSTGQVSRDVRRSNIEMPRMKQHMTTINPVTEMCDNFNDRNTILMI